MKRKDNWPTTGERHSLPQRDGPYLGKSQERAMSSPGELDIRTVEWVNSDGSVERFKSRQGWYLFESEEAPPGRTISQRGFVAKVPGANGRAVLFNPYNLTVIVDDYTPKGRLYEVQDFATDWNVPPGDTTNWYDVVCIDGQTIKINAAEMPALGSYTGLSATALPHIINFTAGDQYGNAERNATEKRYFEVERFRVKSWGGSGVTEVLVPELPRAEERAITIGPRVVMQDDSAWLGQLYYEGMTWSEGRWLFSSCSIGMDLAPPFLTKVDTDCVVNMPRVHLLDRADTTGQMLTNETLPSAPIAVIGIGEIFQNEPLYIRGIRWAWSDRAFSTVEGQRRANYVRSEYSGHLVRSQDMAGVTVEYVGDNTKRWDTRSERLERKTQFIPLAGHSGGPGWQVLSASSTELFWGASPSDPAPVFPPTRGRNGVGILESPITSSVTRRYEEQDGEFSVTAEGFDLVSVKITTLSSYGEKVSVVANNDFYLNYLSDPYLYVGGNSGMGVYSQTFTLNAYIPSTDQVPVFDIYKQNPSPPPKQLPGASDEIIAMHDAMAAQIVTQVLYDCVNSDGVDGGVGCYTPLYIPDIEELEERLTWKTIDFILFDKPNGVFISIEGEMQGGRDNVAENGSSNLTILLRVKTRYDETVYDIASFPFVDQGTGLWPPVEIVEGSGSYFIPSPQIRAMFVPMYQHQGDFKGAHYVTLEEEQNGALPVHLFNFRLLLRSYDFLSISNAINDNSDSIYFVPCNLLEMLYAVVFSASGGLSPDVYAVTDVAVFNSIMNTTFTDAVRIAVRDGVKDTWTDIFGPDFAAVSEVSLHRT